MKVQIVGFRFGTASASITVRLLEKNADVRLPLPIHEVLTEDSLKKVIADGIKATDSMDKRMKILTELLFKDIEIEGEEDDSNN